MSMTGRIPVLFCALSFLSAGCYTTSLIDPQSADPEQLQSMNITKAVTFKDSTYLFDKVSLFTGEKSRVIADSVVGFSHGRRIALPLSNISQLHEKHYDAARTTVGVITAVVVVGVVVAIGYALRDLQGFSSFSLSGK